MSGGTHRTAHGHALDAEAVVVGVDLDRGLPFVEPPARPREFPDHRHGARRLGEFDRRGADEEPVVRGADGFIGGEAEQRGLDVGDAQFVREGIDEAQVVEAVAGEAFVGVVAGPPFARPPQTHEHVWVKTGTFRVPHDIPDLHARDVGVGLGAFPPTRIGLVTGDLISPEDRAGSGPSFPEDVPIAPLRGDQPARAVGHRRREPPARFRVRGTDFQVRHFPPAGGVIRFIPRVPFAGVKKRVDEDRVAGL